LQGWVIHDSESLNQTSRDLRKQTNPVALFDRKKRKEEPLSKSGMSERSEGLV